MEDWVALELLLNVILRPKQKTRQAIYHIRVLFPQILVGKLQIPDTLCTKYYRRLYPTHYYIGYQRCRHLETTATSPDTGPFGEKRLNAQTAQITPQNGQTTAK